MINRNKKIAMSIVRTVLLALFLIAALLPLYWIFVTSIKAGTEIYTFPLKYWPEKPSFDLMPSSMPPSVLNLGSSILTTCSVPHGGVAAHAPLPFLAGCDADLAASEPRRPTPRRRPRTRRVQCGLW